MHPLHDYVAQQLADRIKSRRVVVWYDRVGELAAFVDELRGHPTSGSDAAAVTLGGLRVHFAEYAGSMFELRAAVEPLVCGDSPSPVILYLPGRTRDLQGSVLMELEMAGTVFQEDLTKLARNLLLQNYTLGVVDELIPVDHKLTYQDLARIAEGNGESHRPSILKAIFHDAKDNDTLLASWMASDARDDQVICKDATGELIKLIAAHLKLQLQSEATLAKMRAITLRYVLAGELRSDLTCDPPACLAAVPLPPTLDDANVLRRVARALRNSFCDVYDELADRVEEELGLRQATIPPEALGSIDTFRFEERALLAYAGELISTGRFAEAAAVIAAREHSFWVDRYVARKAQWEAVRRMAELGSVAVEVQTALSRVGNAPVAWLNAYAQTNGWYRLDQAQRRLETWISTLEEDPDERPLAIVRDAYENACRSMAEGFIKALANNGWTIPSAFHQTRVFSEVVAPCPKPVAYFLVDAMRFEMGVELAERLPKGAEVSVRPAVAALPTLTVIGMAALMPGAAASFVVAEKSGALGVRIEDAFLVDVVSRRKFAAARIPNLVDLTLDELLGLSRARLAKKIDGAQVIVIRSQEIDDAGEGGFTYQARQVIDTVVDNIARAIRKLAGVGVEYAVVSADHGHLFATERDLSMRIDPPGGDELDLHRRCWIGRGGTTPAGCVRVSAAALGYPSDFDLVFPTNLGVFRAGGDLAFHHGGPSLQELVVPVLTVRTKDPQAAPASAAIAVTGLPEVITNRIFSVTIVQGGKQLALGATSMTVRPLLIAGGKQVGAVGMAVDGEFDRATGCVKLEPTKPVTVAFLLSDESAESVRVVVQDPATDAELYRSAELKVWLGVF